MTTVLAAVDATEAARPVLETASNLAHVLGANTVAVHVGEDPGLARAVADELGTSMIIVRGEPADEIVRIGECPDVALVVLALSGAHSRHEPGHTALAVATRVVQASPRRADGHHRASDPHARAVPARRDPRCQCGHASPDRLIRRRGLRGDRIARLPAGHRAPVHGQPGGRQGFGEKEFLAEHCADLGIRLATRPRPTADSLLDVAASEDVDIIALGWRQDFSPHRAAVVRQVLTTANRPVALIPLTDVS